MTHYRLILPKGDPTSRQRGQTRVGLRWQGPVATVNYWTRTFTAALGNRNWPAVPSTLWLPEAVSPYGNSLFTSVSALYFCWVPPELPTADCSGYFQHGCPRGMPHAEAPSKNILQPMGPCLVWLCMWDRQAIP
jgi:hypothetical protein